MRLRQVALLIFAIYIIGFGVQAFHLGRTVYGDGTFYYAWLQSTVIDHDIDFANEYARSDVSQPKTARGTYGNKYSIGPALLWAPTYIMTHLLVRGDGWSLPYQITVGITSVLYAITGLMLLTYILKGSATVTSLTILAIAGTTNLLYYGAIDPVNSHALSFFAAAVYLAFLTRVHKRWFVLGVILALIASLRLQDTIYIIAILPFWRTIRMRPFVTGFVVGFIPQLIAWYALYGSLVNPYLAGGETFDFLNPQILGVLFGASNGLYLWTPVTLLATWGLIQNRKKHGVYLLIFCLQVYAVASWSTWWQGASISGRMLVSTLPLMAVGLKDLIHLVHKRALLHTILPLMILTLSGVNALGILYYLATH